MLQWSTELNHLWGGWCQSLFLAEAQSRQHHRVCAGGLGLVSCWRNSPQYTWVYLTPLHPGERKQREVWSVKRKKLLSTPWWQEGKMNKGEVLVSEQVPQRARAGGQTRGWVMTWVVTPKSNLLILEKYDHVQQRRTFKMSTVQLWFWDLFTCFFESNWSDWCLSRQVKSCYSGSYSVLRTGCSDKAVVVSGFDSVWFGEFGTSVNWRDFHSSTLSVVLSDILIHLVVLQGRREVWAASISGFTTGQISDVLNSPLQNQTVFL